MGWADDLLENPGVDKLAQARLQGAAPPVSAPQQPEPPEIQPMPLGPPGSGPGPERHHAGDGHGHTPGDVTPSGELVSWRGGRVDRAITPYLDELTSRYKGLRLSSSYRSPEQNAKTPGAARKSHHMTGRAADFVGSAREMNDAAAWARSKGARESMVHNAGTGYHLHVAW